MIAPVYANENKAKHIAVNYRHKVENCPPTRVVRNLNFKYHDSDDNGDYAIAESFESGSGHVTIYK